MVSQSEPKNFAPIVITGVKNSGKSTFCKALINRILTENLPAPNTLLMDIDVRQPMSGIPGCISLIQFHKPILSNYELNLNGQEKDESIATVLKTYLINDNSFDRFKDYYSGTEYQVSRESSKAQPFKGMVDVLYQEAQKLFEGKPTVVVINTGDAIHHGSLPAYNVRIPPLNQMDPISGNVTDRSLDILQSYKNYKGKTRRNALIELNMYDISHGIPYFSENMKYDKSIIAEEYLEKLPNLAYYGLEDKKLLYTFLSTHVYDLKDLFLSIDMSENTLFDTNSIDQLKILTEERIVSISKIKVSDLERVKKHEEELCYDHSQ